MKYENITRLVLFQKKPYISKQTEQIRKLNIILTIDFTVEKKKNLIE
jgi:hypothetical protein